MSGDYAFYVWTAYGVSFAGLAAAVIATLMSYRHAQAALARLENKS